MCILAKRKKWRRKGQIRGEGGDLHLARRYLLYNAFFAERAPEELDLDYVCSSWRLC
jgi:hypothetical protein